MDPEPERQRKAMRHLVELAYIVEFHIKGMPKTWRHGDSTARNLALEDMLTDLKDYMHTLHGIVGGRDV